MELWQLKQQSRGPEREKKEKGMRDGEREMDSRKTLLKVTDEIRQ